MKSSRWKYCIDLMVVILYTTIFILLFEPWLNLILMEIIEKQLTGYQYGWIYINVILLVIIIKYINNIINSVSRFLLIIGYLCLQMFIIYLTDLPVPLFSPLLFILFLVAYRYQSYQKNDRIYLDLGLGTIFMIINLYIQQRVAFSISFSDVIFYFITGVFLIILYNTKYMEKSGYVSRYRVLFSLSVVFSVIIILLSLLIGFTIDEGILNIVLSIVGKVYHFIISIFLYMLYPVIKVIMMGGEWLINQMPEPREQTYDMEIESGENPIEAIENTEPIFNVEVPDYLYTILQYAIIGVIIFFLVKRLSRREKIEKEGISEERESVFSTADLKHDLKKLLSSLNPFKHKHKKRYYDSSNPVMVIRETYYKFLIYFDQKLKYDYYQTPDDYLSKIKNYNKKINKSIQCDDLSTLTALYNQARYKEKANTQDANQARTLLEKLQKD